MSCCIVIPLYKSFYDIDRDEEIALLQSMRVFKRRPFCFVHPANLDIKPYLQFFQGENLQLTSISFDNHYFTSVISYSRLMLSKLFYKKFEKYDYILIYQTDAFVFDDRIDEWCEKGYSYVGAPWFKLFTPPYCTDELFLVGNGGFSLRKVSHCLKALNSFTQIFPLSKVIKSQMGKKKNPFIRNLLVTLKRLLIGNNTFWLLNDFYRYNNDDNSYQEDYFWGVICKENFMWYRVPNPIEALGFSFEVQPEIMFFINKHQLPMGCHAWNRYNPEFWKPHLAAFGYYLNEHKNAAS